MAQAHRKYGKSLSLCTVGGHDITAIVREATPMVDPTKVNATCLVDVEEVNLPNRQDYRIRITIAVDADFDTTITALAAAVGTNVDYVITPYAGSTNVYGVAGGGSGLLMNWEHGIPDGGQTISFEIIPDGTGGLTS